MVPMVDTEAVVAARIAAGLTQMEAAHRAGIVRSYLCMIESGKRARPTLSVLQALARTYGVPFTQLLVPEPDSVAS